MMTENEWIKTAENYNRSSISTFLSEKQNPILSISAIKNLYTTGSEYRKSFIEMIQFERDNFLRGPTS
jgi:hypothetical protein